jgi:ubiquinone/menaquinone biosynthesis C-methylase UbiE
MWWYRALHLRLTDALRGVNGAVLDAGCGTGGFLTVLETARPDLTRFGVEYNGSAATRAREKSHATITGGSINTLPFADAAFDAAISADVLCHAAVDPNAALPELLRVLKPGGRLVLNLPAYMWLMSAHDRRVRNARRYTAGSAARMLRAHGFTRVKACYWNGLPLPLMIVQRKILTRGDDVSDVAPFPPFLDAMLLAMTQFERRLPVSLPAGGSVLAIAEKP